MTDPVKMTTEAEAIAKLGRRAGSRVRFQSVDANEGAEAMAFALIPDGYKLEDVSAKLDARLDRPRQKNGVACLQTLESFCDLVNRHKDPSSAIFADKLSATPRLVCVLDYHELAPTDAAPKKTHALLETGPLARHGRHRARYDFPLSDEWTAWKKQTGSTMSQADFAEFLENRIVDVIEPERAGPSQKAYAETLGLTFASPSRLMSLSRGLTVRASQRVAQAVTLASGEVSMSFSETH